MSLLSIGDLIGDSTKARTIRSIGMTFLNVLGSNGLRLISNIVLTRLLFPEAFGLMALTQVFIYALKTFSDVGIDTSIIQNERGDDPVFVNTAWTLKILRGLLLWFGACLLAWPAAQIYNEPRLMSMLPVVALTVLINGFTTTREAQANRHLILERVVFLYLGCQFAGLVITAVIAYVFPNVWALIVGNIISEFILVVVFHIALPGPRNMWMIDRRSARELFNFGAFIFLSTILSFFINMSDRAILGAYIDTATFGIFNIALMFGTLPGLFSNAISQKVLFPLYRIKPPAANPINQQNVFKTRRFIMFGTLLLLSFLSYFGIWIVTLLYDTRYTLAGPMVVLFTFRATPNLASLGSHNVMLAAGDSRRFFYFQTISAAFQVTIVYFAIRLFGIVGAILGPGCAMLLIYPVRAYFVSRYKAWDAFGELSFMACAFALTGGAFALYWDQIRVLF